MDVRGNETFPGHQRQTPLREKGVRRRQAMKQKVTLSIDSKTYSKFKQYCEENAIMLSKKVELWMSKEMESPGCQRQSLRAEKELKHGNKK
ncbi:MAG: hypothetical protein KAT77_04185 [Nanoarchaeota archaeon]|nr:hypothetical protein [Nanoarchaeota archaeon]